MRGHVGTALIFALVTVLAVAILAVAFHWVLPHLAWEALSQ